MLYLFNLANSSLNHIILDSLIVWTFNLIHPSHICGLYDALHLMVGHTKEYYFHILKQCRRQASIPLISLLVYRWTQLLEFPDPQLASLQGANPHQEKLTKEHNLPLLKQLNNVHWDCDLQHLQSAEQFFLVKLQFGIYSKRYKVWKI